LTGMETLFSISKTEALPIVLLPVLQALPTGLWPVLQRYM